MNPVDDTLVCTTLRQIDDLLKQGILPVHNGHLVKITGDEKVLDVLVGMRVGGLISGDLVTVGDGSGTPHRMTNIRLTYAGLSKLRKAVRDAHGMGAG